MAELGARGAFDLCPLPPDEQGSVAGRGAESAQGSAGGRRLLGFFSSVGRRRRERIIALNA